MKKFIYFYVNDFEERGVAFGKGRIYAISDEGNGLAGCLEIELSQDQLDNIFDYLYVDGKLSYDTEGVKSKRIANLRIKRQALLVAFDKYKTNVLLGLEGTTTLSDDILIWYHAILDLDEDAINNPPERILYYL